MNENCLNLPKERDKHASIKAWVKKNLVFCIACMAALLTSYIIHPDEQYLGYFDWKTLTCLFCVSAIVCALSNIQFFYSIARKIVELFKDTRTCILALVYITFIGSMLIANDMALITFLPLGYLVLKQTKQESHMAFTFIMQNIAANLGGMLTPFGNPQNLYLYSYFNISVSEFVTIMLPPFLGAVTLITLCCLVFVKKEPMMLSGEPIVLDKRRTIIYLGLFAFSIIIIFRVLPYWLGLIVIPIALFLLDKNALKKVDYPLLGTFFMFFIFSGNMSRMDAIAALFSHLLAKSTLWFSTLSCQFISNVPTAILLSKFTTNYQELLVGVNIGGCGTLIASLASLITFREYMKHNPGRSGYYIKVFSIFNFAFLGIMLFGMSIYYYG